MSFPKRMRMSPLPAGRGGFLFEGDGVLENYGDKENRHLNIPSPPKHIRFPKNPPRSTSGHVGLYFEEEEEEEEEEREDGVEGSLKERTKINLMADSGSDSSSSTAAMNDVDMPIGLSLPHIPCLKQQQEFKPSLLRMRSVSSSRRSDSSEMGSNLESPDRLSGTPRLRRSKKHSFEYSPGLPASPGGGGRVMCSPRPKHHRLSFDGEDDLNHLHPNDVIPAQVCYSPNPNQVIPISHHPHKYPTSNCSATSRNPFASPRVILSPNPFSPRVAQLNQCMTMNSRFGSTDSMEMSTSTNATTNTSNATWNIGAPTNPPPTPCRNARKKQPNMPNMFSFETMTTAAPGSTSPHANNTHPSPSHFKNMSSSKSNNFSPIKEECNSSFLSRSSSPDQHRATPASPLFPPHNTHNSLNNQRGLYCETDDLRNTITTNNKTEQEISPTDIMAFPFDDSNYNSNKITPPTPFKSRTAKSRTPTKQPPSQHNNRYSPTMTACTPPRGGGRFNYANADLPQCSVGSPSDGYSSSCIQIPHTMANNVPQSRFNDDFDVLQMLGSGSFGKVYQCLSKLDGCMYAIKAFKKQAKGVNDRERMLKEVYALAALCDRPCNATFHIVRYHQAWMENNRLYIQTELCTCTLQHEMSMTQDNNNAVFVESLKFAKRKYRLLREMLLALELLHRNDMVHLDIKPENIFIKDDVYKLGDFGLVTKASLHNDVEEGDSRFMASELLQGDHSDLTKSDIFSLGATLYEVCLNRQLPADGPEWHDIRKGLLCEMQYTPLPLQMIIREMMSPNFKLRPTASELLQRRELLSEEQKELIVERNKVLQANRALEQHRQVLKRLTPLKKIRLVRRNTWDVGLSDGGHMV